MKSNQDVGFLVRIFLFSGSVNSIGVGICVLCGKGQNHYHSSAQKGHS